MAELAPLCMDFGKETVHKGGLFTIFSACSGSFPSRQDQAAPRTAEKPFSCSGRDASRN